MPVIVIYPARSVGLVLAWALRLTEAGDRGRGGEGSGGREGLGEEEQEEGGAVISLP